MGRYYSGDIEGKFWFAVQSSGDIENLVKIDPTFYYMWKACSCSAESYEIEQKDNYCGDCYESKEEHEEAAKEEDEDFDKDNDDLYIEDQTIGYSLDKDTHYDELIDSMNNIKNQLDDSILREFEKLNQDDNLLDAFTGAFDKTFEAYKKLGLENDINMATLLARYTLATQIEYCLRVNDCCNVQCEC